MPPLELLPEPPPELEPLLEPLLPDDPDPLPEQAPPWHVCPTTVQSWQEAAPVPQVVSSSLVLQLPLVSQHPVQDGSQVPEPVAPSEPPSSPVDPVAELASSAPTPEPVVPAPELSPDE